MGWEDYYSRDIFRVEGFPLQRPDWRVIYCNCLLYVFPTRNIVNFLSHFTFLSKTYFSEARYSLFELKVPLNPNHLSILWYFTKSILLLVGWLSGDCDQCVCACVCVFVCVCVCC